MPNFQKFIPLVKIDEATRTVFGVVTAERPDRDGEICHYASTVPYYNDLNQEFSKATEGKSIAPLREMHQLSAVGCGKSIDFRDPEKEVAMGFKVVDDAAWQKVKEGVYTGFSQGGNYVKTWRQGWTDPNGNTRDYTWYTAKPGEISLVDSPCLKDARFEYIKADGSKESRAFKAELAGTAQTPDSSSVAPSPPPVKPAEFDGQGHPGDGNPDKCASCGCGFKAEGSETLCPKCTVSKIERLLDKAAHGKLRCQHCGSILENEDLDDGECQECGADLTDPENVNDDDFDDEDLERVAKTTEGAIAAWVTRRANSGGKKAPEAAPVKAAGGVNRSHDLENTHPGHSKEYHLKQTVHSANQSSVAINYGKIGGASKSGYLRPDGSMSNVRVKMPHADASRVYEAKLNEKLGRGYDITHGAKLAAADKPGELVKTPDAAQVRIDLYRAALSTTLLPDQLPATMQKLHAAGEPLGLNFSDETEKLVNACKFLSDPLEKATEWTARQMADIPATLAHLQTALDQEGHPPTQDLSGLLEKSLQTLTAFVAEEVREAETAKGETNMTPEEIAKAAKDQLEKSHGASVHLQALHAMHKAHCDKACEMHKGFMASAHDTIGKCMKAMGVEATPNTGGGEDDRGKVVPTSPEITSNQGAYPGEPHSKVAVVAAAAPAPAGLTLEQVSELITKALDENTNNMLKVMVAMSGQGDPMAELAAGGIGDRSLVVAKAQTVQQTTPTQPAGPKEADGTTRVAAPVTADTVHKALKQGSVEDQLALAKLIKSGPMPSHLVGIGMGN